MADTDMSIIARRLGLAILDSMEPAARTEERRSPAANCAGCDTSEVELVFMSNGGDYCRTCAAGLAQTFGYGPVGMREDDITALD